MPLSSRFGHQTSSQVGALMQTSGHLSRHQDAKTLGSVLPATCWHFWLLEDPQKAARWALVVRQNGLEEPRFAAGSEAASERAPLEGRRAERRAGEIN